MNLSIAHCRSVASVGALGLLMGSLNYVLLAEGTTSASQSLRVTVDGATGNYAIGQPGSASDVLIAAVVAKVDGRCVYARDYPKQLMNVSFVLHALGVYNLWHG